MEHNQQSIPPGKIEYLQMIQDVINRMATTSSVFKGFVAMIIIGVTSLKLDEPNTEVLYIVGALIVIFAVLDYYYLKLELGFRRLYDEVALNQHPIDFEMKPETTWKGFWDFVICLKSFSIWGFYLPIFLIVIALLFFNVKNGEIILKDKSIINQNVEHPQIKSCNTTNNKNDLNTINKTNVEINSQTN